MHGIYHVIIYKKGYIAMGHHLENCMIYAVDFDGTLCENKFPDIGYDKK